MFILVREEDTSALAGFHAGPPSWSNCNLGVVFFVEGRKSSEQGENQIQPTYGTRPELNQGHIGGRQALSPLRHPCSPNNLISQ